MQRLGFTRIGNPQGRPLALIHGWACDSQFLMPVAKMFLERDVYLIDLPGYGKSAHLAPLADNFAATTYLLLNTIPVGSDVVSWSFGTLYALRLISIIDDPLVNLDLFSKSVKADPAVQELLKGDPFNLDSPEHGSSFERSSILATVVQEEALNLAKQLKQRTSDPKSVEANELKAKLPGATHQVQAPQATPTINSSLKHEGLTRNTDLHGRHSHERYIRSLVTICGSPRFPSDPNWKGLSAIKILKCNTKLTPRRLNMVTNIFYRLMTATSDSVAKNASNQEAASQDLKAPSNAMFNANAALLQKRENEAVSVANASLDGVQESSANHDDTVEMQVNAAKKALPDISYEVLMAGIKMVTYLDERPAMSQINIPTLHLFGAQDPLVPCAIAPYFERPPLHRTYIFPYSSHSPMLSEPKRFFKVVHDFYDRLNSIERAQLSKLLAPLGHKI